MYRMKYIKQNKLGLIVLIRNEITLLKDFLERNSIPEIFSEAVFLDDFSTDGSYELLLEWEKKKICKVYRRKLNFHFGEQRNFGDKLVKSSYIFNLDADYTISEGFKQWICNFKPKFDTYWSKRKEIVGGKEEKTISLVSAYKNVSTNNFVGEIHESFIGSKHSTFVPADCYILHKKSCIRCEKQNKWYYKNFAKQREIVNRNRRKNEKK